MLSVICTGRNDNYGGDFVQRASTSIGHNLARFSDLGIEFEYLLVEWMPFQEYLINTDQFHIVSMFPAFRTISVDRSVAEPERLDPDIYFEYFAKNAGIRRARYDNILLINADIILPPVLCMEISSLCEGGLDCNKFYRNPHRYNGDQLVELHNPSFPDACICGAYSGDFLLVDKEELIERGQGYNETDPDHRITYQTGMDGELLWNMYNDGMRLEFLNSPYKHLPHGKDRTYDNYKIGQSYKNKAEWGFIEYPSRLEPTRWKDWSSNKIEIIYYEPQAASI